jgi:hypothetical protein
VHRHTHQQFLGQSAATEPQSPRPSVGMRAQNPLIPQIVAFPGMVHQSGSNNEESIQRCLLICPTSRVSMKQPANRRPEAPNFPCAKNLISPAISITTPLSCPPAQINHFRKSEIHAYPPRVPVRMRDVRVVTNVGPAMRWTLSCQVRLKTQTNGRAADGEVVWFWRSDAGAKLVKTLQASCGRRWQPSMVTGKITYKP